MLMMQSKRENRDVMFFYNMNKDYRQKLQVAKSNLNNCETIQKKEKHREKLKFLAPSVPPLFGRKSLLVQDVFLPFFYVAPY